MRNSKIRILSFAVAVMMTVLVFTSCADNEVSVIKNAEASEKEETITDVEKDETVYVITSADGSPEQIIVSDHLINNAGLDTINDVSSLSDIENVKGEEAFTRGGGKNIVWNAGGNDIYYQGNSDGQLPIDMKITYKLDGKTVEADEIAGKSGHVSICFDYTNNEYEMMDIGGSQEKIYVPFICITGMLLDSENNENIVVSNGKIINDGQRTAVMGIAMPGLKYSLGTLAEDYDIPSSAEISFDTDCFSIGLTATIVSPEFSDVVDIADLTDAVDIDAAEKKVNEMDDAMVKLMDGSSDLYDGLYTLLQKSGKLSNAVNTIYDGSTAIKNGSSQLKDASSAVSDGASALASGLAELESNNNAVVSGAETVFDTLLSAAETQLKAAGFDVSLTRTNFDAVLDGIIASLDEENVYAAILTEVTATVESQADAIYVKYIEDNAKSVYDAYILTIEDQVYEKYVNDNADTFYYAAAYNSIIEQLIQQQQMTEDEARAYLNTPAGQQLITDAVANMDDATKSAIRQAVLEGLTDDQKALIREAAVAALTDDQKALIREAAVQNLTEDQKTAIKNGAIAQIMESDEVKAKMAEASDGLKQVVSLKNSLDSYNAFYHGILDYTSGVTQALSGAEALRDGASQLSNGASSLYDSLSALNIGIGTLKDSVPQLVDGVDRITDGSIQISDGLSRFYNEGIKKLAESVSEDILPFAERFDAIEKMAEKYINFSGISSDMNGSVKFVFRSAAVEK